MSGPMGSDAVPDLEQLTARLRATEPSVAPDAGFRPAAVLVPLRQTASGLELIFTLRTGKLSSHAGQVSFPGGRCDQRDEDRWGTALREAEEELSIPEAAVTRLHQLDEMLTITDFHVTPCVGLLDPSVELVPAPDEVAEVFTVPLARFYDPRHRRTMTLLRRPHRGPVTFFMTSPHVVWGATAQIIDNLVRTTNPRPA